jgi:amino acid permease
MRNTIAILCLVIVLFGALLGLITYQLRRALLVSEEAYDAAEEEEDAQSHHTRHTRQSTATTRNRNNREIEHRELTEREIQMISRRT